MDESISCFEGWGIGTKLGASIWVKESCKRSENSRLGKTGSTRFGTLMQSTIQLEFSERKIYLYEILHPWISNMFCYLSHRVDNPSLQQDNQWEHTF